MAETLGVSPASVLRHWRAYGLKPHLIGSFKISRYPKFSEKLEDIKGLYLSPPEHALVLCCDEKSQSAGTGSNSAGVALEEGPRGPHDS